MPKIRLKNEPKSTSQLIKELDVVFSKYIRARDEKCIRCNGVNRLTCSHYWSRKHRGTRYDEDNCMCLCFHCHWIFEKEKQGEYTDLMLRRLGQKRLDLLKIKALSKASFNKSDYAFLKDYYSKELRRITKKW